MNKPNIIIPMAGHGTRFSEVGYQQIKPLIRVNDKTMIEWSIESLGIDGNYIFIILKDHEDILTQHLKYIKPNCTIITLDSVTRGATETCLKAEEFIDNDTPLLII